MKTTAAAFKDHFSGHAADYQAGRPTYPEEFFAWLQSQVPSHATVLDVGCGNGQASIGLASRFPSVFAIDASAEQIRHALPHSGLEYGVAPAEATGFPENRFDLIVATQAFHWFDHERFFPELKRIAKPGALFVAAGYNRCSINSTLDLLVEVLYHDLLDAYWPPERCHVENEYRDLPFPLKEIEGIPRLQMSAEWDLYRFYAYLGTWSSLKAYQRAKGEDPRTRIADALLAAWGDPTLVRKVSWPLSLRAGRT